MTALTRVTRGENPANSDKLNQVIDAWNGNTAGVNQGNSPLSLTAINDALNYALAIKNADAAGKGLIIYAPDGVTPLLRVDKTNGVYASPDGTAAAAPISTTTGTQTLTNKTLTSPVVNGTLSGTAGFNAWTDFSGVVTLTQSASVAVTVNWATYTILGKLCVLQLQLTATATGATANDITIGGIPAAIAPRRTGSQAVAGNGVVFHSGPINYQGAVVFPTTTTLKIINNSSTGYLGTSPSFALAVSDVITAQLAYELA